MNYFFECPTCGTYVVDRQTFEAFITPKLKEVLGERLRNGIGLKPIVRFIQYCPHCKPNSEYNLSLEIEQTGE